MKSPGRSSESSFIKKRGSSISNSVIERMSPEGAPVLLREEPLLLIEDAEQQPSASKSRSKTMNFLNKISEINFYKPHDDCSEATETDIKHQFATYERGLLMKTQRNEFERDSSNPTSEKKATHRHFSYYGPQTEVVRVSFGGGKQERPPNTTRNSNIPGTVMVEPNVARN